MSLNEMNFRIWTPERQVLDVRAGKIIAEAENGFFCLLPRHIDYLAGLVSGIISYWEGGEERFVATDKGIMVKCGSEVMVSVRNAISGEDLRGLEDEVRERFTQKDRKEEEMSMAMNQLEAAFIRHFIEMNGNMNKG